jgi:hypothetical protein
LGCGYQSVKVAFTKIFFDGSTQKSFRDLPGEIKEYLDVFQPHDGRLGDGKDHLAEFAAYVAEKMVCYCPSPQPASFESGIRVFILLSYHALFYLFLFILRGEEFMRSCRCCFILQGKSEAWESATKRKRAIEIATKSTQEPAESMSGPQKRRAILAFNILSNLSFNPGSGAVDKSRAPSRALLSEART